MCFQLPWSGQKQFPQMKPTDPASAAREPRRPILLVDDENRCWMSSPSPCRRPLGSLECARGGLILRKTFKVVVADHLIPNGNGMNFWCAPGSFRTAGAGNRLHETGDATAQRRRSSATCSSPFPWRNSRWCRTPPRRTTSASRWQGSARPGGGRELRAVRRGGAAPGPP